MLINPGFFKYNKTPLLCVLLSGIIYYFFAYHTLRTEAWQLLFLYTFAFVLAYVLKKTAGFNFSFLVVAAILLRLVFLFAIPNLSQDFYRFIWDGRMILEGLNPYLFTPESFISTKEFPINQAQQLFNGMGELNASHYTNYPPLNQLCFSIAALFSGNNVLGSVITMRLLIIAADIGTLYFGKKLLEYLRLPSSRIWWYILNPFIIIELTGSLHFEGVMIFFLVFSFYLLSRNKWKLSAIIFACSISIKLIPLMLLPLFFWWFTNSKTSQTSKNYEASKNKKIEHSFFKNLKSLILFYIIVISTVLLLFLPFFSSEFINNYSQTVGLWFTNFEFNASFYYLAREIGYLITGYNEIAIIGKILPLISVIIILYFSFFKKNNTIPKLVTSMLFAYAFYLFFSTTVHPWYLTTLVALCIFTKYRFPLIWSFVIILSYLSYIGINTADKYENLWFVGVEYAIVFSVFIWEVLFKKQLRI